MAPESLKVSFMYPLITNVSESETVGTRNVHDWQESCRDTVNCVCDDKDFPFNLMDCTATSGGDSAWFTLHMVILIALSADFMAIETSDTGMRIADPAP